MRFPKQIVDVLDLFFRKPDDGLKEQKHVAINVSDNTK
jgi:hypothetical protein